MLGQSIWLWEEAVIFMDATLKLHAEGGGHTFKPTELQRSRKGSLPSLCTQVWELQQQRKRKLSPEPKTEESVKKKKTNDCTNFTLLNITVSLDLPLVFPSLSNDYNSIIVQHITSARCSQYFGRDSKI